MTMSDFEMSFTDENAAAPVAAPAKSKAKSKPKAGAKAPLAAPAAAGGGGGAAPADPKNASDTYEKLEQREHVLKRPDMYGRCQVLSLVAVSGRRGGGGRR